MPEFRCTSCSKLLRTPHESAGKKAKCPQCGAVVDVPGTSDAPSIDSPPADAAQNPFSTSPVATPGAQPESGNPYAAPTVGGSSSLLKPADDGPRGGLPWERDRKSVSSFWETAKLVIGSPNVAFNNVSRQGGLGDPLLFAVAGGFCGALINAVYNSLFQIVLLGFVAGAADGGAEAGAGIGFQVALQFVAAFFGGTIAVIFGVFVSAGLYHLFLWVLKGANHPFEATFRVVAYVTGAVSLLQVIPICGQYVYTFVGLVYMIVGLQPVQQTTVGKAAGAVLLPVVVCLLLVGMVVGLGVMLAIGVGGAG